jgi:hypothetical protein
MTGERVLDIVTKYGAVLESEAPMPGCVADVTKLPFPKAEIKEALVHALRVTSDAKMKDFLKIAYVQLADWQEGVGANNPGLDIGKVDRSASIEAQAIQIASMSKGQNKWSQLALAEGESLKKELEEKGLW